MDLQSLKPQGYIDGNWCGTDSGETFAIDNPATSETIAHMPRMGASEMHQAIDAMVGAFPAWRERTAAERTALLKEWHRGAFKSTATTNRSANGSPIRYSTSRMRSEPRLLEPRETGLANRWET